MTDKTITETLKPLTSKIIFDYKSKVDHPNTMKCDIHMKDGSVETLMAVSPGGGSIRLNGEKSAPEPEIYPEKNFSEIKEVCKQNNWDLVEFVRQREGDEIFDYLDTVYDTMMEEIDRGLMTSGLLPGKLHVPRRAKDFLVSKYSDESETGNSFRLMLAYAFAAAEENAAGGVVVTAPTCGSCGVLPSVLKFYKSKYKKSRKDVINALAVAGIIGNCIKYNASLSGAEAGCQVEIGSACSMAAAAYAYMKQLDIHGIECAAEVAMEHSLGLTCDPVGGYVIIPCIERNGMAAIRAVAAGRLAEYANTSSSVSFDDVVQTMYRTGKDMKKAYRETGKGGLAEELKKSKK
jgi:L-serine dehydratase